MSNHRNGKNANRKTYLYTQRMVRWSYFFPSEVPRALTWGEKQQRGFNYPWEIVYKYDVNTNRWYYIPNPGVMFKLDVETSRWSVDPSRGGRLLNHGHHKVTLKSIYRPRGKRGNPSLWVPPLESCDFGFEHADYRLQSKSAMIWNAIEML